MTTNTKMTNRWLEMHVLQNFAPNNLNRDDTGAPKDAMFGGVRRARISSQCLKRATREHFATAHVFGDEAMSVRTKRTAAAIGEILSKDHDLVEATAIACRVLESVGLKLDEKTDKTKCLVFMPQRHLKSIAGIIHEHWKALAGAKKGEVPGEITGNVAKIVADASKAPEIALFGRMIAEGEGWGIEAAAQVAHSISTHEVNAEFDFFTALDDLAPKGDHASAHMDTATFSSACHYRYSAVSVSVLRENLGDESLVMPTLKAYIAGQIAAMPGGKQAGFAAHNPPSYVLAVVHDGQPYSLANAFARPVRAGAHGADLVGESILAIESYRQRVDAMYGARTNCHAIHCADRDVSREPAADVTAVTTVAALVDEALKFLGTPKATP
jgi:CRISPR system Cascade subunit CasC